MTDTPLIDIPEDPNAPKLVELGEDGEAVVILNTLNPELARRMIVEHFRHVYDAPGEADAYADTLDDATFTTGYYWWKERQGSDDAAESELIDAAEEAPPTTFPGVHVRFELSHL